jgi:hypothetical protein
MIADIESNSNNNVIMYQEAKYCNSRCLYCITICVIQCSILGGIMFILSTILMFIIIRII